MADQFYMTKKGYDEAVERLNYLSTVKRREIVERIAEARSYGDLSENAEYTAAREEQSANEGEIMELEYQVKNAVIIKDSGDTSVVRIGCKVEVLDLEFDEKATYEITGTTEADPMMSRISNESPVGKALLGASEGDVVTVAAPNGSYSMKVIKIF